MPNTRPSRASRAPARPLRQQNPSLLPRTPSPALRSIQMPLIYPFLPLDFAGTHPHSLRNKTPQNCTDCNNHFLTPVLIAAALPGFGIPAIPGLENTKPYSVPTFVLHRELVPLFELGLCGDDARVCELTSG